MTYTILGCDVELGRLGIALATHSIAAGGYCQRIVSSLGAVASQAYADPRLLPVAIDLLESGAAPKEVVRGLGDVDSDYEYPAGGGGYSEWRCSRPHRDGDRLVVGAHRR